MYERVNDVKWLMMVLEAHSMAVPVSECQNCVTRVLKFVIRGSEEYNEGPGRI